LDTDAREAITEKVAAATAYTVDYVGLDLKLDGFAVEAASGDAATFAAAVGAVRESSGLPLILVANDPAVIEAGLNALDGEKPLILGANSENWEAMAALAKQAETSLGVTAGTLEELAELTEKIQAKGVQDQIRRLALKNFRPLGYPTIAFAGNGGDPAKEAMLAAHSVCKYAGLVVMDTFSPELVYPILVLRENIFTDPQKPIQVLPAIYEINGPKADDPVLVTTNFSITYFSVANEVEGSGQPAWLVVADAEGMSVLTAWAAGKFDAESIAKAFKQFGVDDKVSKKIVVLPGHVAVLSGELEEELPGWEIKVGPREAVDLPAYMKAVLT
jgi:acetyl-CoA decarbonylase/synthase complex subunit gamma